jgi:hypothetical protein
LWAKLLELYEGGAHRALGYSSWGMSKTHANRQIDAAGVASALTPIGVKPSSEGVARELAPILRDDPERVEEVWAEVVEE